MAQNIYDRPDFFEGYSQLGRSVEGLAGAVEWPALRSMLPGLSGLRVVDLGCGFGWFCRWAREQGAAQVLGLDVSERMLTQAQNATMDSAITYKRGDLEEVELPAAQFDLAYSSLALHYVEDLARLFAVIHRSLVPGGRLVFSTEHPIYMAPTSPGWSIDANGRKTWPMDSYLVEGPRTTDWLTQLDFGQLCGVTERMDDAVAEGGAEFCRLACTPGDEEALLTPELAPNRGERVSEGGPLLAVPSCS